MNSENNFSELSINDALITPLVELAKELDKSGIPLILGGGLSLYLRTTLLKKKYSPRFPKRIMQRSTKDIDFFLTSDLIADPTKVGLIRDALDSLGYKPVTKYFQFSKRTPNTDSKEIMIDILSAPPFDKDLHKIKTKGIRIKPEGIEKFHAYLVKEAKDINLGLIQINDFSNLNHNVNISNLFIPSSFNYIVLKLHAFRDRVNDQSVDYGQHHAYDIFATVIDMDQADWENAEHHLSINPTSEYIRSSQNIIATFFSNKDNLGIIRLRENKLYQRDKDEYDKYIQDFISDLKDLFNLLHPDSIS
jgi:hypothetical protein